MLNDWIIINCVLNMMIDYNICNFVVILYGIGMDVLEIIIIIWWKKIIGENFVLIN